MKSPGASLARRLDWLPLALALPLYLVGIGWGWGPERLWSWDEVPPAAVVAPPYAEGESWPAKYPLLQRDLLRGLFGVTAPLARAAGVTDPQALDRVLFLAGRSLTLLLALATLSLVSATAARLASRRAGWIAAGIWLATLPQTYYAKTMNLDAPYLFWFALAVWGFVAWGQNGGGSGAPTFVLAAAAAVLTKDQSYGLFVLPALALVATLLRGRPDASTARRTAGRLALALAAAIVGAAASYRLFAGPDLLRRHLAAVLAAPATYGTTATDLAGPWDLAWLGLRHVAWSFGTPLALLVAAGVAVVLGCARGREDPARATAALLLFPLSYAIFTLAPLGYHYDRFFLPVCWTLAVVAGVGFERAWSAAPRSAWRALLAAAMAAALGWGLARAAALDAALAGDRRLELERDTRGRSRVAFFTHEVRPPQGFVRRRVARRESPGLAAVASHAVVAIPAMDLGEPGLARLARDLRQGACGFRPVRPELAAPSRLHEWIDFRGMLTNLAEIDPPILVFERDGPPEPCREPPPAAPPAVP